MLPLRARLCIAMVTLPALWVCIADINSWPFSNYPMYSAPMRFGPYHLCNAYMVTENGRSIEIRNRESLWPLNYQRLQVRARLFLTLPDGRRRLEELLQYYGQRAVQFYQKDPKPGFFPSRLQIRKCHGETYVVDEEIQNEVERYEVVAEVETAP